MCGCISLLTQQELQARFYPAAQETYECSEGRLPANCGLLAVQSIGHSGLKGTVRCAVHQRPLVAQSVDPLLLTLGVLPSRHPFNISLLSEPFEG